jgi:hypothetical protein
MNEKEKTIGQRNVDTDKNLLDNVHVYEEQNELIMVVGGQNSVNHEHENYFIVNDSTTIDEINNEEGTKNDGTNDDGDDNNGEDDDGDKRDDDRYDNEHNINNNIDTDVMKLMIKINTGGTENEVLRGRVMNKFDDVEWTQAEHSELYFAAMTLKANPAGSRSAVEEEKVWFEFLDLWIEMKKSIHDSGMRDEVGNLVFLDGSRPSSTWVKFHDQFLNRYFK